MNLFGEARECGAPDGVAGINPFACRSASPLNDGGNIMKLILALRARSLRELVEMVKREAQRRKKKET